MSFLQMSLSGAVMILAIIVIRALAMNRLPKKTFLALWCAALVRLLVPFSLPSGLSIYSLLAQAPVPAASPAAVRLPVVPSGTAAAIQSASPAAQTISPWTVVWIAGTVLCAAVFAVAYWRCQQEFRMSLPVDNAVSRQWLQAHPLRRTVAIRRSDRISSPLTFGVLHPVILMPKGTDWEDGRTLQYVLEHEFVHIQRFDTLSKLLLIGAVCVHWFNPMVWVLYVLANRDLELSCDETVVRRFGSGTRASYANVLIRMEETRSGFAPLCNHFSKNAMEERITAIMKTKKTTILSLAAALTLVAGTVTVFATSSAKPEAAPVPGSPSEAVETGVPLEPNAEYQAAGITLQGKSWYYQGTAVAGIYDDNGNLYMDNEAENGSYLHISRDSQEQITEVSVLPRTQFRELVDRHMNLYTTETTVEESSIMSYVDPADGKTYYSFDDGQTFAPLTDAEFEALYPTPDIAWWTYDEYKAWLDNEKVQLQGMLGEHGWTSGDGSFVWTQEKIDEAIALYEGILADIKNGMLYSKSVDGRDDEMVSFNPASVETYTAAAADAQAQQ